MKRCVAAALCVMLLGSLGLAESAVLTVDNCEELATMLAAGYPDYEQLQEDFADAHIGETIGIDGFISDADIGSRRDVEIHPGNYQDAESGSMPGFLFEDLKPEDFGMTGNMFPDFIERGKNVRITGTVKGYDDFDDVILLEYGSIEKRDLYEDIDTSGYTTLEKGSKGDEVAVLQQRLTDLYYLNDTVDGSYGNKTKAAVEKFQNAVGIDATGIADPKTQAVLFADDAPENQLSISCSSISIGSSSQTSWYVDGESFTLSGGQTKIVNTPWGTFKFYSNGEYEKIG